MENRFAWIHWAGLIAGPILAIVVYLLLPDAGVDAEGRALGLSPQGKATAAVGVLMAIWWLSEATELSATALVPIALFPILGITTIAGATAPYANPVIFLFLGGFLLGLAMERWGLHRRIALLTILAVGTKPKRMIAGFMLATAVMSMWVSNTATAVMMMPIGISVIHLVFTRLGREFDKDNLPAAGSPGANFATCLMLGIAYGASIGGIGTLIGTPPNVLLAGYIRQTYDQEISFFRWMLFGMPLVAVFLPLAWYYLVNIAYPVRIREIPGGAELVRGELADLGRMKRGEWIVLIVFGMAALSWVLHSPLANLMMDRSGDEPVHTAISLQLSRITDEGIAIAAGLLLFLIPVDPRKRIFTMNWATAERVPWGILILFGGGLSLAGAIRDTGVDAWIGRGFDVLAGAPLLVLVFAVAVLVIYLTEMTSNTAVTTTMLVVLGGAAVGLGVPPEPLLVAAAVAASCAFMLPVATPPNAIVFSTGYVSLGQMVKAGFWLNIAGAVLVSLFVYLFAGWVLGLDLTN